jgi:hypothetical protein
MTGRRGERGLRQRDRVGSDEPIHGGLSVGLKQNRCVRGRETLDLALRTTLLYKANGSPKALARLAPDVHPEAGVRHRARRRQGVIDRLVPDRPGLLLAVTAFWAEAGNATVASSFSAEPRMMATSSRPTAVRVSRYRGYYPPSLILR